MQTPSRRASVVGRTTGAIAGGIALAAAAYSTYAGITWFRYGKGTDAKGDEIDPLLDQFMPAYEVVERHHVRVAAPAATTLAAACEQDLMGILIVRAIFKARELVLGSTSSDQRLPRGLLPQVLSLGWGVLAEVPDREIVVGAVTKPWEANVVFRALPAADFARFDEPSYVKIAWSLRADPLGDHGSIFRTETRAIATDAVARARFRRYWAFASPGIALIRRLSLAPVKKDAERRALVSDAERHRVPRAQRARFSEQAHHDTLGAKTTPIIAATTSDSAQPTTHTPTARPVLL